MMTFRYGFGDNSPVMLMRASVPSRKPPRNLPLPKSVPRPMRKGLPLGGEVLNVNVKSDGRASGLLLLCEKRNVMSKSSCPVRLS